ncbi:MAG TPA: OmpA family protein [Roseiflexaceae bacterium]|nr:OmpA family protein [Roseiflexaceae bacterium]
MARFKSLQRKPADSRHETQTQRGALEPAQDSAVETQNRPGGDQAIARKAETPVPNADYSFGSMSLFDGGPVAGGMSVSQPGDPAEIEAEAAAEQVMSGQPVGLDVGSEPQIQRSIVDDVVMGAKNIYHDVAEGVGLESHDEAEAARLQAFIDHGIFGPEALVPPTNIGGFDASYDPDSRLLLIEVRSGVDFIDGLTLDAGGQAVASHTDLAQAAVDANTIPDAAQRAEFVAQFTWDGGTRTDFLDKMQSRVEDTWAGQYTFNCIRPGWEALTSGVAVDVQVHEGKVKKSEHLQTSAYKVPDSGDYSVGAFVQSHGDQDPHNNEMVVSSTDVNPTPDHQSLLQRQVFFEHDSAALTPDSEASLRAFERDFQDANLDLSNPVELIGHASSSGSEAYNQKLAQRRIDTVRKFLDSVGFTGITDRLSESNQGEQDAEDTEEWRRVDLIVGDGQGQLVMSHEFGHVFGLDDEYVSSDQNPGGSISGSGSAVGAAVGHDGMARSLGVTGGAIAENNDGIMSLGNNVREQHYATFGWALQKVTGIDEWQIASP